MQIDSSKLSLGSSIKSNELNSSCKLPPSVRITFLKKNSIKQENIALSSFTNFFKGTSQKIKCQLCCQTQNKQEMDSIAQCQHLFCSSCLQKYCTYKINVMEDVKCPEQRCQCLIKMEGTVFKHLSQVSKQKYKKNMLLKQSFRNEHLRLCPIQNCQGFIDFSRERLTCSKCKVNFCKQCQLPYHEGTCDTNFEKKFKDLKRCPRCRLFIEKTEGCNHISCRCGHEFCYICLSNWSQFHYECRNEQIENENIFQRNEITEIPLGVRMFISFILILIFPGFVGLIFAFIILSTCLSPLVGLFFGPMLIISTYQVLQGCLGCIAYPFLSIGGAIAGLFLGISYSIYLSILFFKMYWLLISQLLCAQRRNNHQQQQDFQIQVL